MWFSKLDPVLQFLYQAMVDSLKLDVHSQMFPKPAPSTFQASSSGIGAATRKGTGISTQEYSGWPNC